MECKLFRSIFGLKLVSSNAYSRGDFGKTEECDIVGLPAMSIGGNQFEEAFKSKGDVSKLQTANNLYI